LQCKEFVNADEIAKGLSPFQPEKVSIEAGRLMLKRIEELINSDQIFSFETTLSSRSFVKTIEIAKSKGYYVTLIYFWLESFELAKNRVEKRVKAGGHNIPEEVIERRYKSGLKNLFNLYENKVDYLIIYDNSNIDSELIADKELNSEYKIYNPTTFNMIKTKYND
jgi:predicted ABC-type ATPase